MQRPIDRSTTARIAATTMALGTLNAEAQTVRSAASHVRSIDAAPGDATFNNNFEGRANGLTTRGRWTQGTSLDIGGSAFAKAVWRY